MESRRRELGTMGPPPAVAHPSNNKADVPPLPASSNAKTAAPPRRIIKTINLDFKKLKEAGLDRKLAEVLSKQNPGPRAGITSTSSSSSSSVASQSASASTSTATATETLAAAASTSLHSQQHQLHQPALPQPLVKRVKISEYMEKTVPIQTPQLPTSSSTMDRSMHVKAMLKNRILNKSINTSTQAQPKPLAAPKTPTAAAQGSAPRSGVTSNAVASGDFSIPKADLSVRPKQPPLLLNLVNQLPKHRAMCITSDKLLRNQQEQLQQKAFEKHPPQQKPSQQQQHTPHVSRQQSSQDPQHIPVQNPPQPPSQLAAPEVPIIFQKSPSPPLIVLENKVLAPNEKIDLSDLRLPSNSTKVATILTTKSQLPAKAIIKGKVIMNASKLKVSREKLAEMAKEIRNQAKQVKLSTQSEAVPPAREDPIVMDPKEQPSCTLSNVEATKFTSLKAKELPTLTPPAPVESSEPISVNNAADNISNNTAAPSDQKTLREQEETTECSFIDFPVSNPSIPETKQLPKPVMSAETSFLDLPMHISTNSDPKQLDILPDPEKQQLPAAVKPRHTSTSSQECPESIVTTEPREQGLESSETSSTVPKVQSAVDFIAQLTAEHPLDESSFMDLSPEEQRLNALFGGSGGCSFTGVSPQKSEKELPQEQNINTLIDGGSLPSKMRSEELPKPAEEELPIGKIMKMDDMDILHATLDVNSDSTNILRISPNAIKLRSSAVALDESIQQLPEITTVTVDVVANTSESFVVVTPDKSQKDEQSPKQAMSIDPVGKEATKGSLENQNKPVPDPEPAKDVNPPAKRVPIRSKKAKINLVQRTKRPSIPSKPLEAKKTKLDDVEESDPSLLEEDRGVGVKAIEVQTDEEQEVRSSTEDEMHGVRQPKEDEDQGVRSSTEEEMHGVRDPKEDEEQGVRESTEDEPKEASPANETKSNSQADDTNSVKSTIERDLTQLYHPPKMPKTKASKKNSNQEAVEQPQPAAASISLIEILSQEQPPPQGDAKLPFRKEYAEVNPSESTGIQNLITLLTAEKVSPQTKKKLSPTPPGSEETTKTMPRKKRVKTRPVLSKRSSRKQDEMATNSLEFLHPNSASLGGGRIPTSSTSDDDGTMFLGFDNNEEKRSKTPVRSKRVRQMKMNETDISDDATPDYDETEEEHQQKPVDFEFLNRHKHKAYDSESSDCPMDFVDNSTIEETSCDKTLVSSEAESSSKVLWEDLKGKNEETPPDTTIVSENQQQEALNEPEPVIDEKDSSNHGIKSRRSKRKSKNPSAKEEMEIPAIKMNSEEPSTSRKATKTSEAHAKLKSKTVTPDPSTSKEIEKSFEDSEKSSFMAPTVNDETSKQLETMDNLVSNENKPIASVKSKGKRRSRCITPTINVTLGNPAEATIKMATNSVNVDSEQNEVLEDRKNTIEGTQEKRLTRISSDSEPMINKGKEEQPIEATNSVKSTGKRASRSKAKADSLVLEVTKFVETSGAPEELIETPKPRASRSSLSRTPKLLLPSVAQAQQIAKSEESNIDTSLQKELEEFKAAEEPNHSKNSGRTQTKRKSRSRKSTVIPPVAKDDVKLDEKPKNTDLEMPQEEVKATEQPDHSQNLVPTKSKRQSCSKSPKVSDSAVSKDTKVEQLTTSRQEPGEEKKAADEPNQGLTSDKANVPDDEGEPLNSVKSTRNRQSRKPPKSVSTDEKASIASPADSQSAVVDTIVARSKRKTSSRLSSVQTDTAAAPASAPKDEVILDLVPKRGRKSIAASQPMNPSEALLTGGEDDPQVALSTSKRGRKRTAPPADTESLEASKRLKTDIKSEPGAAPTFNLRLLLIRQREQLDSEEVLTEEGRGKGPLQCGLCLARSTEKDWPNHLGEHYGVGWLIGETPTATRSGVLKMMKKYIDGRGGKLTCRLCQQQLGSHTGMVVHLESCGNKQRVECDLCKRTYAKLSLAVHRQSCLDRQKKKEECSFNLRLLLIRKREQLDSDEVLTEEGEGKGPLQCGLCLARSSKQNWQTHVGKHYGVGWLVGETPTNITRNWVILMMKAYLEDSNEKLICRLCDRQLGSALGMMLHLENCGHKQRVECKICHRSYSALTLPGHLRLCSKRLQLEEPSVVKTEPPVDENASETVYSNAGRTKRKSTIKAETKLKKIGEDLSAQAPGETIVKHEFDTGDSSDYDMEKDKESSEEYDSEGVDSNEDSINTDQEGSDCDKSKRSKKRIRKKRPVHIGEHATKPLFLRDQTQEAAGKKWKEFLQFNYANCPLYSHLEASYSTLPPEEASSLLPSKDTTSARYAYGNVSETSDWKRLAPLEGFNKKGEYIGYLGGAVKQLIWVPLPSKITDQYLLCSVRPKIKSFARHSKLKLEESLLMLLKCKEGSTHESWSLQPKLHYGIRVPNGPVHSFAFLPSGGYDQTSNRLGLLAVANSTSDVHIYALPLELKDEEKCEDNVVIQLNAVITLSLDVDQSPAQDQCTKICWSEASGHNFLATGYASGRIAFWDISDTESINCIRRNDDQAYGFVPINVFYLGERNIQFMELHYDGNGPRWLAVGTLIRRFLVYDIMNWSQPTPLMQNTLNNVYLATFTWSPISEALVLSSTPDYNSRAILLSPAGVEFDHRTLDSTLTASRAMHTNCPQNHMVLVTDLGDLAFLDVKDLNCGAYLSKTMVNYRAVSTTKLHHLGTAKPSSKLPINADEFIRDYGVQINPLVGAHPQPLRKCPYLTDKRRPSNPHSLSLTRVNCVRCNWNSSAHTWVAMGAEHGMLRILNFKRNKFF